MPPPTFLVSQPLSPCVSVPHRTPNSPSQKGSQRREGPGVPGVPIPSCLTSSRGPWRPLRGLTPRMVTFSCGPVLPAADICTPQRTEKAVLGPGHTGLGLTCLFPAWGAGANCSPYNPHCPLLSNGEAAATFAGTRARDNRRGRTTLFPVGLTARGPMCPSWAKNAGGPRGLRPDCSRAGHSCPQPVGSGKCCSGQRNSYWRLGSLH